MLLAGPSDPTPRTAEKEREEGSERRRAVSEMLAEVDEAACAATISPDAKAKPAQQLLSPAGGPEPTSPASMQSGDTPLVKRSLAGNLRSRKITIQTKIGSLQGLDSQEGRLVELAHPAVDCCTPGAVASVWGKCSDQDKYQPFFSGKSMNFDRLSSFGDLPFEIGIHCQRGHKTHIPNQDDFFVLQREGWLLCGVADGHGQYGHEVSHFVQEHLPKSILSRFKPGLASADEWRTSAVGAFEDVVSKMKQDIPTKCQESGATASVVCLSRQEGGATSKLRTAHVGDSTVVYARKASADPSWEVRLVTRNHRPDREDEMRRIKQSNGEVVFSEHANQPPRLRVPSGDMAVSRAFGDIDAVEFGLSSEPEVEDENILEDKDEHLVLVCSDGVWDVFEPQEAVNMVAKFAADDSQRAAERLAAKSQSRWQQQGSAGVIDDITVILIRPKREAAPP
eukprot:TRINITY_DN30178_c0_g1_i2.p1 TRINITY_DN30178_c0_g1~~TRINITY_DN30178_c0_g1_i2.p1  ORF type:complete len:491 (-),score=96.36 TRINITY_DN30178_c0_g1_i2:78-1433(-)